LPVLEKICWQVLRRAEKESILSSWLKGSDTTDPPLQHAIPLFVLERELVLHHTKAEIEDTIYFLEKRGYLVRHGFQGLTRVAYQLTPEALAVLASGSFAPEEQSAFQEAILDLKRAELWGLKLNISEAYRRVRKRFIRGAPRNQLPGEGGPLDGEA